VSAAAIGAHLVGGVGLLLANRDRVQSQAGVTANTAVKALLTGAAVGTTADSGVLGSKIAKAGKVPAESGVVPPRGRRVRSPPPSSSCASCSGSPRPGHRDHRAGAQQGEQQRPTQVLGGLGR